MKELHLSAGLGRADLASGLASLNTLGTLTAALTALTLTALTLTALMTQTALADLAIAHLAARAALPPLNTSLPSPCAPREPRCPSRAAPSASAPRLHRRRHAPERRLKLCAAVE